jgi:hypothetical protein
VVGAKFDFSGGYSFNIEAYYKQVFDRAYSVTLRDLDNGTSDVDFLFDGEGRIWGFDLMLQKLESRYWSGWISYSFNSARYRNPQALTTTGKDVKEQGIWFYPQFHRFHNLNLIVNIKPTKRFNIMTRLGFASGRKKQVVGGITFYPVLAIDSKGNTTIIEKYKRESYYSDDERTTWSIPLDLKFSLLFFNRTGKVHGELYVAIENLASLFYKAKANTSFNAYTGQEDRGSDAGVYEIPLPMPSLGLKWTY